MKNRLIIKIIMAAMVIFLFSGRSSVLAAEYNIRDGAYDDTWRDFVYFYEAGACDRATINGIINAGGISPDIAVQLNRELDAIDAERNTTNKPQEQPKSEQQPTHKHNYKESEKTEKSCTEPRKIIYVCECGDTYDEAVEAGGHHFEQTTIKEPSCDQEGEIEYKCVYCGAIETEIIPQLEHTEGPEDVITEPSCDSEGIKIIKCEYCDMVMDEESIAPLGHEPGTAEVTAPFFVFSGKKEVTCEQCGIVLESEAIPPYTSSWVILAVAVGIVCVVIGGIVYGIKRKKNK